MPWSCAACRTGFFLKKEAKTFASEPRCRKIQALKSKSFLVLFFKKERLPSRPDPHQIPNGASAGAKAHRGPLERGRQSLAGGATAWVDAERAGLDCGPGTDGFRVGSCGVVVDRKASRRLGGPCLVRGGVCAA
jgi:hypothetical protein